MLSSERLSVKKSSSDNIMIASKKFDEKCFRQDEKTQPPPVLFNFVPALQKKKVYSYLECSFS